MCGYAQVNAWCTTEHEIVFIGNDDIVYESYMSEAMLLSPPC